MGRGVILRDGNRVSWEIKKVLYADDAVLVTETRDSLQHIVSGFERAYDCMG